MQLTANRAKIAIQGYLDQYTSSYQSTMEQLSSGSKYNSISESPVDYCQSGNLKAGISANNNIIQNVALGNDLLSIAEGAESNVSSNISAIRDLCLQAASETYTSTDKDKILSEIRAKLSYVDLTSQSTTFAGKNLLDGTCTSLPIQISSTANDKIDVANSLLDVKTTSLGIDLAPTVTGANWTSSDIYAYMDKLDLAINSLTTSVTNIGNYSTRLDAATVKLTNMNQGLTELNSSISDTDVAEASSDVVKFQILQQSSVSILVQANQMVEAVYSLLKG